MVCLKQIMPLQIFYRLSSTNFPWWILCPIYYANTVSKRKPYFSRLFAVSQETLWKLVHDQQLISLFRTDLLYLKKFCERFFNINSK